MLPRSENIELDTPATTTKLKQLQTKKQQTAHDSYFQTFLFLWQQVAGIYVTPLFPVIESLVITLWKVKYFNI